MNYLKLKAKAENLIANSGGVVEVGIRSDETYDPISGEYATATSTVTAEAVILPYQRNEGFISDTLVTDGMLKVVFNGDTNVTLGNDVIISLIPYKVIGVKRISPDGILTILTIAVVSK